MEIATLNTKITIQKQTVDIDAIGNHINEWSDYYTCHAAIGGENDASRSTKKGSEEEKAAQIVNHIMMDFTVRYCNALKDVTSTGYRVKMGDDFYDIVTVNHMNNKRKVIRLRCKRVDR